MRKHAAVFLLLGACGGAAGDISADDNLPEVSTTKADGNLAVPIGSYLNSGAAPGELQTLRVHGMGVPNGTFERTVAINCITAPCPAPETWGAVNTSTAGQTNYLTFFKRVGDSLQLRKSGTRKWLTFAPVQLTAADVAGHNYVNTIPPERECGDLALNYVNLKDDHTFELEVAKCDIIKYTGGEDGDSEIIGSNPGYTLTGTYEIKAERYNYPYDRPIDRIYFDGGSAANQKINTAIELTKTIQLDANNQNPTWTDGFILDWMDEFRIQ